MREVEIILSKETFMPGDTVEGHVLVKTDNDFDCNGMNISFIGEERSRIVIHAGKVTIVYDDDKEHVNDQIELASSTSIPFGETRYDFSFSLPEDVPSSYLGTYGWITYTLEAKIEVSWARDPKAKVIINVESEQDVVTSQGFQHRLEDEGVTLLRVEGSSDILHLGEDFSFRLNVDRASNIRGVRAEIVHIEHVEPDNHETDKRTSSVEWYLADEEIQRDSWIDVTMKTEPDWPLSFSTELIQSHYILKVTLDIALRLDKVVEIPIRLVTSRPSEDFTF